LILGPIGIEKCGQNIFKMAINLFSKCDKFGG